MLTKVSRYTVYYIGPRNEASISIYNRDLKFNIPPDTIANQSISLNPYLFLSPVVNVGLGTYIFNDGISDLFLVYLGHASFVALLFGMMFLIFSMTITFIRDPG